MNSSRKHYVTSNIDSAANGGHHDISTEDTNVIIQDVLSRSDAGGHISSDNVGYETGSKQFKRQDSRENKRHHPSIRDILQPILICLSVSGCYDFCRLYKDFHKSSTYLKSKLAGIYRKVLFIIIVLAIIKFVVAFFYLSKSDIMPNTMCVTWQLMCLSYFLGQMKATNRKHGHQERVFAQIDNILDGIQHQGINFPMAQIRRSVMLGTTFGTALVLINIIGIALQVRFHAPSKNLYTAPFEPTLLALSVFFLCEFILTLVWIFPFVYNITVCRITKHIFKHYNIYLKASFHNIYLKASAHESKFAVQMDFQQMRIQHLKLCDLVKGADADMCWFFASACVFNLGLSCFSLYQLVKAPLEQFSLSLYILWLLTSMVSIGLVTIFAALVNEQAHGPLEIMYNIEMENASVDQAVQLQLFLSKLTGIQVGFTTCGLLTITKEFILTMAGLFLTYFAVLYTL